MRPVRDLVVAVSGACQLALRDAVEPSDRGVVGLRRGGARAPAPQDLPAAPGPVRDGLLGIEAELERIAGNVIHAKRDRRREIAPPRGFALTRPAEDQVKVDVKAFLADRGDRDGGVLGLMRAAERAKSFGREALRPDRSPGDSKCDPRLEARAVERRGVCLDRRFPWPELKGETQRGAERCDLLWFEQARRAAPDVERADTRPAEPHALARDLIH